LDQDNTKIATLKYHERYMSRRAMTWYTKHNRKSIPWLLSRINSLWS